MSKLESDEKCPLPKNKSDVATARKLILYDGTVNKKDYASILVWLKNNQYPIFSIVASFLVSKGEEVNLHLWQVMKSNNGSWKKNVIKHVISQWPKSQLKTCVAWLPNLVTDPDLFGPDLVTIELLIDSGIVSNEWLGGWLDFKKEVLLKKMDEVEKLTEKIQ